MGAIVYKKQNPDTGVKYETRISFWETVLSLDRALVRTKRTMRMVTANIRNKEAHQIPFVRTERSQGEMYSLRKQQSTQRIIPGSSKYRVQIKKEVPRRG